MQSQNTLGLDLCTTVRRGRQNNFRRQRSGADQHKKLRSGKAIRQERIAILPRVSDRPERL